MWLMAAILDSTALEQSLRVIIFLSVNHHLPHYSWSESLALPALLTYIYNYHDISTWLVCGLVKYIVVNV